MAIGRVRIFDASPGVDEGFDLTNVISMWFEEKLNQLNSFEIVCNIKTDYQRSRIKAGTLIFFYRGDDPENNFVFAGFIEKLTRSSNDIWILEGVDMAGYMTYKQIYGKSYPPIQPGQNYNPTNLPPVGFPPVAALPLPVGGEPYSQALGSQALGDPVFVTADPFPADQRKQVWPGSLENVSSDTFSVNWNGISQLKAVQELASRSGGDWWVVPTENALTTVYPMLQISAFRGNVANEYLFYAGQNCINLNYTTDTTTIVNKVTVLGAGEGPNQLKAVASDAGSIATYGVRESARPYVYPSVTSQSQLDLIATILKERLKNPRTELTLQVTETPVPLPYALGDNVNVKDEANFIYDESGGPVSPVSNPDPLVYRIVGKKHSWQGKKETISIQLSDNIYGSFMNYLGGGSPYGGTDGSVGDEGATHASGSTTIIDVTDVQNVDASHEFIMGLYIPASLNHINQAKFSIEALPYQSSVDTKTDYEATGITVDSNTTGISINSAGSHTHNLTNFPEGWSPTYTFGPNMNNGNDPGVEAKIQISVNLFPASSGDFVRRLWMPFFHNSGSGTWSGSWRLRDTTVGANIATGSFSLGIGEGILSKITDFTHRSGNGITLELTTNGGDFDDGSFAEMTLGYHEQFVYPSPFATSSAGSHTHGITDPAHAHGITDPTHRHDTLYAIHEEPFPGVPAGAFTVFVNGNSLAGNPYGGSVLLPDNLIDITSVGFVPGQWNEIKVFVNTPPYAATDKIRLKVDLWIQGFIIPVSGPDIVPVS